MSSSRGFTVYTAMAAQAATGAGSVVDISGLISVPGMPGPVCQVIITGTATVQLQQSLDQTNWVTEATTTVSDSFVLPCAGVYYRPNVSAFTSGTVTVLVGPGQNTAGLIASPGAPTVYSTGPS